MTTLITAAKETTKRDPLEFLAVIRGLFFLHANKSLQCIKSPFL